MNIIDKPKTHQDGNGGDLERFRLRRFIEAASRRGARASAAARPISPTWRRRWKAIRARCCSRRPGRSAQQLVGSVTGSRSRIARAFGVAPNELLREIQRRMRNKPEIVEVSRAEAPAQQVVLTGADADLTALPVHLQHGADGAPYISASTDFVVDPKTGFTNVGIRRLMLRGRTEAGVDLNSPSDLRAIYEASAAAGKPVPVAFVVGSHPIDHLAAVMRLPTDDLALMSSLRDAPLPVVKCVTNDVRVPADAEWVLEGVIDERGHVEPEGPVRRIPRLLRRGEAQSGVPPHRDHAPPRRAVPDLDHRRQVAVAHRHRAAQRRAHRGDGLARAGNGRARAGRASMRRRRAAACTRCGSRSASACRARRATPSPPASARSPT